MLDMDCSSTLMEFIFIVAMNTVLYLHIMALSTPAFNTMHTMQGKVQVLGQSASNMVSRELHEYSISLWILFNHLGQDVQHMLSGEQGMFLCRVCKVNKYFLHNSEIFLASVVDKEFV